MCTCMGLGDVSVYMYGFGGRECEDVQVWGLGM